MLTVIKDWFQRYFSDPEAILLVVLLIVGFALILGTGYMLSPLFASIIIAYFLDWLVNSLTAHKIPRLLAVIVVYLVFLGLFLAIFLILWPLLWRQMVNLLHELPIMLNQIYTTLDLLPEKFPNYITKESIGNFTAMTVEQLQSTGKKLLSISISFIPNIIMVVVYLVLVPFLVFFLLKDGPILRRWMTGFLPTHRPLLRQVWKEMNQQIGSYVRGKVIEIGIVGIGTFIGFYWFNMQYAVLLAFLVGVSVIIPYVGIIIITIPVALVGFFQWGMGNDFFYMMMVYLSIQLIDGQILVPLLFSKAVALHPIAIIMAVLVFGSLWGFWGVFFAIPLATLIKAILNAWPAHKTAIA